MNKLYLLTTIERPDSAIAYTIGNPPISHELIPVLEGKTKLPFDLVLKHVTLGKKGLIVSDNLSIAKYLWQDYQPNCLAWPIMSQKMREVIEASLTGNELIDWINVKIRANEESRMYYIMRFNKALDVLDMHKTRFIPGTSIIVKPFFLLEKTSRFSIFSLPEPNNHWKIPSAVYITQYLKEALEKANVTGADYEDISLDRMA